MTDEAKKPSDDGKSMPGIASAPNVAINAPGAYQVDASGVWAADVSGVGHSQSAAHGLNVYQAPLRFAVDRGGLERTHVTIPAAEWQAMQDRLAQTAEKMRQQYAAGYDQAIDMWAGEIVSRDATIDRLTTANAELGARVEALEDERDGWGKAADHPQFTKEAVGQWLTLAKAGMVPLYFPTDVVATVTKVEPTAAPIPARTLSVDDSAHGLRMPKGFW